MDCDYKLQVVVGHVPVFDSYTSMKRYSLSVRSPAMKPLKRAISSLHDMLSLSEVDIQQAQCREAYILFEKGLGSAKLEVPLRGKPYAS
jgi:hypothetical protein